MILHYPLPFPTEKLAQLLNQEKVCYIVTSFDYSSDLSQIQSWVPVPTSKQPLLLATTRR